MKKKLWPKLLPIVIALVLCIGLSVPALAATTQDVTITATPTYIALTNSQSTWVVGTVAVSST